MSQALDYKYLTTSSNNAEFSLAHRDIAELSVLHPAWVPAEVVVSDERLVGEVFRYFSPLPTRLPCLGYIDIASVESLQFPFFRLYNFTLVFLL